jgi:hypothetical protein
MLFCLYFFQGERDGPLHFVDSSKAPTPASRYGGYHSIYHTQNYSGSITPLSCYSHPFEMMHIESLREKLNRLTRDKGFFNMFDVSSMRSICFAVICFVLFDVSGKYID